jgi:uncharacterized phiE125 gp8 family phage protein
MSNLPYLVTTITASTAAPVTAKEVKDHSYIDTNLQDSVIQRQINAASRLVEIWSRRQLMQATFDVKFPYFPCDGKLPLPRFPAKSVTSISYYNSDNGSTTLASSDYNLVAPTDSVGYVERLPNRSWPNTASRSDAVTVRFVAGSTSSTDVPDTLKQAICLTCADWFRERQNTMTGTMVNELPIGVKALVSAEFPGTYP